MNGMKNTIMQVTYLLNATMVNLLLYCHIILYREKITCYEKCSNDLTLELQIVSKISAFQCYRWKHRNAEKWSNFQKFKLKWKILKHFVRPKQWAASKRLFSPAPDKNFLLSGTKIFLRRYTFAFEVLQEYGSWTSRNGAVQILFSETSQKGF